MSVHQFQSLMAEIGPLLDEIQQIEQRGDQEWCLVVDEASQMYVHASDELQKATFITEIADINDGDREAIYEILLLSNSAWEDSQGVRFALSSPGGTVMMHFELPTAGLEVSTVAGVVRNLFHKTRHWRQLIEQLVLQGHMVAAEERAPAAIRV